MRINSAKRFLISLTRSISNTQMIRTSNNNNLAVFDFQSICEPEENFKNTETTTWFGEHVTISVSISWNLLPMPIFLCNCNPCDLVEFFIDAVEGLATKSKDQMKLKFLEVETAIRSRLTRTLESLNESRCRNHQVFEFEDQYFEDDNKDASAQILQRQENQLIELQEHLERYCNVLPRLDLLAQNTTST